MLIDDFDSKIPSSMKSLAFCVIQSAFIDLFCEVPLKDAGDMEINRKLALLYLQGLLDKDVRFPIRLALDILNIPYDFCNKIRSLPLVELEKVYLRLTGFQR